MLFVKIHLIQIKEEHGKEGKIHKQERIDELNLEGGKKTLRNLLSGKKMSWVKGNPELCPVQQDC